MTYDYVIAGAGTAGCVLAYRLSEDPACKVLLIEAGGSDDHPLVAMPKGMGKMILSKDHTWLFKAYDSDGSNAKPEPWRRGKLLGGSSSINGMMYVRGHPADFDALAAQTSDDWNWAHIGAAYQALESHELGVGPARGDSGPLRITMPTIRSAFSDAVIAAGVAMGLPGKIDVNTPDDEEAVGYAPRFIHRGRRQSAATAFLRPAEARPNLTVATKTLVNRVLFDGKTAVGLACEGPNGPIDYVGRKIILAGGTVGSPAILQRSGVGPAGLLESLGVPVVAVSEGVGADLKEQRAIRLQWRLRKGSVNRELSGWRLVANALRYGLTRGGQMSTGAFELGAWIKTRPEVDRPNAQIQIAPYSFDTEGGTYGVEKTPGMNIIGYIARPNSTGWVRITDRDPRKGPRIDLDYFQDGADRTDMVLLFRAIRRLVAQAPLREYVIEESWPGPKVESDADILEAFRTLGSCALHAVGTCRMGADEQSVVDPRMRVRGVDNLLVADLSIAPFQPAAATFAPTAALAWRGADLILADAG